MPAILGIPAFVQRGLYFQSVAALFLVIIGSLSAFFPPLFFPFETVDISRGLTFLSFAIALNRARISVCSPKMVKIGGLGFRSTEKYFPMP